MLNQMLNTITLDMAVQMHDHYNKRLEVAKTNVEKLFIASRIFLYSRILRKYQQQSKISLTLNQCSCQRDLSFSS